MVKNLKIIFDPKIRLDKLKIHRLVSQIKSELNFSIVSLQVNIVNSNYIFQLNQNYLSHDRTTDIITFNYSGSHDRLEGEIFISFQDTLDNALRFNVNFDSELVRLIIHGILHLLGYDDSTPSELKIMKKIEDELVYKYSVNFNNLLIGYDCENS